MKWSYILRLSFRNLIVFKLRSFLTIAGVAIAIGFITFLIAFAMGIQETSTNQIADIEELKIIDVTAGQSKIVSIDEQTVQELHQFSEISEIYPEVSAASDYIKSILEDKRHHLR
jgi:ABC-type antimicrobial peptide transport system permease subunit